MSIDRQRRRFLTTLPGAAGALWLASGLGPTPSTAAADSVPDRPTVPTSYGPFYREKAPYRAKVSPPLADGVSLVLNGRIWGLDTRRPLGGALMDVWQVDAHGRYSDGVADRSYRARLLAAEDGAYEFETIHPVAYQANENFWRSPHIHFQVIHPGYRTLVSEFFFQGDPRQEQDPLFRKELLVPVSPRQTMGRSWELATFDLVLAPA